MEEKENSKKYRENSKEKFLIKEIIDNFIGCIYPIEEEIDEDIIANKERFKNLLDQEKIIYQLTEELIQLKEDNEDAKFTEEVNEFLSILSKMCSIKEEHEELPEGPENVVIVEGRILK